MTKFSTALLPILFSSITFLSFFGCISTPQPVDDYQFASFPKHYQGLALEYKKQGRLHKALQYLYAVRNFTPEDQNLLMRIDTLEKEIASKTASHIDTGIIMAKKGTIKKARREFLRALYYNPENETAITYLKEKLNLPIPKKITAETAEDIAIEPETTENMAIEPKLAVPAFSETEKMVMEATNLFNATEYGEAFEASKAILAKNNNNEEAQNLIEKLAAKAQEAYDLGKEFFENNKLKKAIEIWIKTLSWYPTQPKTERDIENTGYLLEAQTLFKNGKFTKALTTIKKSLLHDLTKAKAQALINEMKQKAEEHYKRGLKFYLEENIVPAIREWTISLSLDPDHEKAGTAKTEAEIILKKLEAVQ